MTLSHLIERLKQADQTAVLRHGFTYPHSYRGYYEELAVEPAENVRVADMLAMASDSLGKEFTGYKGGEFTMREYTTVYLANYGSCGEELNSQLLEYWLKDTVTE